MADLQKLVEELSSLTVIEAANLSKQLEEKWGVSAAAPVAMAAAPQAAAAAAEEQTHFDVVLVDAGSNKIGVIKEIRAINSAIGLIQAKEFVEKLPNKVKEGVKKDEAQKYKAQLEAAGAKVEIK
jgi:large subunit ribosomal protein L7/L12